MLRTLGIRTTRLMTPGMGKNNCFGAIFILCSYYYYYANLFLCIMLMFHSIYYRATHSNLFYSQSLLDSGMACTREGGAVSAEASSLYAPLLTTSPFCDLGGDRAGSPPNHTHRSLLIVSLHCRFKNSPYICFVCTRK